MPAETRNDNQLLELSPDVIFPNPENPRIIFREHEMIQLLESISSTGIQVPITVYKDGAKYILLDGERRWRCSKRLNIKLVPSIVHPKPSRLENLLMMFNIHNVRVQWDIMPTAYKLRDVQELLKSQKRDYSPKSLSAITGVRLPTVKRCLELLDLPKKYRDMLMAEAEKPKSEQTITADLFIEINKSFNVIERYVPQAVPKDGKGAFVDAMVNKYKTGGIKGVTDFRDLSKLARAELAGVERQDAVTAIKHLISKPSYSIKNAFEDTVQAAYEKRDLLSKLQSLNERIKANVKLVRSDELLRSALISLRSTIDAALKG